MNVMPTVLQRGPLLFATFLLLLMVGYAGNAARAGHRAYEVHDTILHGQLFSGDMHEDNNDL